MNQLTIESTPKLSGRINISKYDNKSYVISVDDEKCTKLSISPALRELMLLIDGYRSIEGITREFNSRFEMEMTTEDTVDVLNKQLIGLGILEGDDNSRAKGSQNFLNLNFILLSSNRVKQLAKPFVNLFQPSFFYFFLTVSIFGIFKFINSVKLEVLYDGLDQNKLVVAVGIYLLSILIHEIGHAAACLYHRVQCGEVGAGFFFIFPALYADVSDAWRLKRWQRLQVDLGGVFLQGLFCLMLLLLYFTTKNGYFAYPLFLVSANIIFNLNPLLRLDGYWILSDIVNIPNLRQMGGRALKGTIRRFVFRRKDNFVFNLKHLFLTIYGFLRFSFLIIFMGLMFFNFRQDIFLFFPNILNALNKIIFSFADVDFSWFKLTLSKLFAPFIFHLVAFRYLRSLLKFWLVKISLSKQRLVAE